MDESAWIIAGFAIIAFAIAFPITVHGIRQIRNRRRGAQAIGPPRNCRRKGPNKTKGQFLGLERGEWWFWIKWVLVSIADLAVGLLVLETVGRTDDFAVWTTIFLAASGAVLGTVSGTAQWVILRGRVHRFGWWVVSSAVGLGVGLVAGLALLLVLIWVSVLAWRMHDSVAAFIGWTVFGAVVGALVGTAQWIALRKRVYDSGCWILASVIGWTVGGAAAGAVPVAIADQVVVILGASRYGKGIEGLVWLIVGISIAATVGRAITGFAMIMLLQHPIPEA